MSVSNSYNMSIPTPLNNIGISTIVDTCPETNTNYPLLYLVSSATVLNNVLTLTCLSDNITYTLTITFANSFSY